MADFSSWSAENLVKFAFESSNKISEQEQQIRDLKSDLKACMEAYRKLNAMQKEETRHPRSAGFYITNNLGAGAQ